MTGLFLRIYAGVALTLMLGLGTGLVLFVARLNSGLSRGAVVMAVPGRLVASRLASLPDAPARQEEAKRLAAEVGFAVRLDRLDDPSVAVSRGERRTLREGAPVVKVSGLLDRRVMFYFPVVSAGEVMAIGPLPPLGPEQEGRGLILLALVFGGVAVGVISLIRPLGRQLAALAASAQRLGRGELGARCEVRMGGAAGELVRVFNEMASSLQTLVINKQELLRAVSHELRTPLSRLRFALATLEDETDAESRAELLRRLDGDVESLNTLVSELLTCERLRDAGALSPETLGARALLAETREAVGALRPGTRITVGAGEEVTLEADRRLLRRALQNLASNAVRYGNGEVVLGVEQVADEVHFTVDDDGAGVPEADRERIFQPFVRLEQAHRRDVGGVGLGLALVDQIATRHDGRVTVGVGPLGGARFTLAVPSQGAHAAQSSGEQVA